MGLWAFSDATCLWRSICTNKGLLSIFKLLHHPLFMPVNIPVTHTILLARCHSLNIIGKKTKYDFTLERGNQHRWEKVLFTQASAVWRYLASNACFNDILEPSTNSWSRLPLEWSSRHILFHNASSLLHTIFPVQQLLRDHSLRCLLPNQRHEEVL